MKIAALSVAYTVFLLLLSAMPQGAGPVTVAPTSLAAERSGTTVRIPNARAPIRTLTMLCSGCAIRVEIVLTESVKGVNAEAFVWRDLRRLGDRLSAESQRLETRFLERVCKSQSMRVLAPDDSSDGVATCGLRPTGAGPDPATLLKSMDSLLSAVDRPEATHCAPGTFDLMLERRDGSARTVRFFACPGAPRELRSPGHLLSLLSAYSGVDHSDVVLNR